ncbi:MAG: hypothetical protein ACREK2_07640 [Gemmatimonadota bacterium]
MPSIRLAFALLSFVPSVACAQASTTPSTPQFPVGFRVDRLSDPTRPFASAPGAEPGPRPIQAYLWYPAAGSCATPMTWGEVVEWVGVEGSHDMIDSACAEAGRSEFVAWIGSMGGDTTAARASLEFPLRACQDAAAAPGAHPLVLLAVGRNDSPAMHALLGEELASYGWVVLSSTGLGARRRTMDFVAADIEAQVADLEALASHAESLDFVDPSRPDVVGYSSGGGTAILYAMEDMTVSAVVSLDGSIGFADRVPAYVSLPGWRPDRASRLSVLHMRAPDEERKDLSALEGIGRVVIMTFDRATHSDFTTLGPVSASGLPIEALGLDDSDGDEIHAEILAEVVEFLGPIRPLPLRD